MTTHDSNMHDVQSLLDRHFQNILAKVETHSELLHKQIRSIGGLKEVEQNKASEFLAELANDVYLEMGAALYHALPLMQPEDFRDREESLNLYFWPGYRTQTLKNQPRLYYLNGRDPDYQEVLDNVGVGLYGRPQSDTDPELYHQCCQARWYHYATAHPERLMRHPGSVYRWFVEQMPRISQERYDLLHSFSVQIVGSGERRQGTDDKRHELLELDQPFSAAETKGWGDIVAKKINEMTRGLHVRHPEHHFPDRLAHASPGRPDPVLPDAPADRSFAEADFRGVRCLLMSLWMHSVFCEFSPKEWRQTLMTALEEVGLRDAKHWIDKAQVDHWANDWGDKKSKRPLFRDWTTISLYPGSSQSLGEGSGICGSGGATHLTTNEESRLQTVGSAILLSSVRLRPKYIGAVRPWIRSVYGLLIGVDAAIRSHNYYVSSARQTAQDLALVAGPWIAHEMNNIFRAMFERVPYEMANCAPEAVRLRRQAWETLRFMAELSDSVGRVISKGSTKEEMQKIAGRFVEPLANEFVEKGPEALKNALFSVARGVYRHRSGPAAIQEMEGDPPHGYAIVELREQSDLYAHCLVLVHEIITNFKKHTKLAEPAARFYVHVMPLNSSRSAEIKLGLTAKRSKEEHWESESFRLLGFFLETTGIGAAGVDFNSEPGRYHCWLKLVVELGDRSHENTTQASRSSNQ